MSITIVGTQISMNFNFLSEGASRPLAPEPKGRKVCTFGRIATRSHQPAHETLHFLYGAGVFALPFIGAPTKGRFFAESNVA